MSGNPFLDKWNISRQQLFKLKGLEEVLDEALRHEENPRTEESHEVNGIH